MVDESALGFLDTAGLPIFSLSKALPGFFIALVANFLPTLAELYPKFSKLLGPSAAIVLSITVIDFSDNINFTNQHFLANFILVTYGYCARIITATNTMKISFEFFLTQ